MKYEFTSPERSDSFWLALDSVARERTYLLFLEGPDRDKIKGFLEEVIEKNWTQFFAIEEDRVVGWCDIICHEKEGLSHVGHVGMGVIEEFRGQGIGERLLKMSIEDAFSKGVERIELEAFSSNHRAIALYEKIGFVHEGRKRKARLVDEIYDDFIIMGLLKEEL